MRTVGSSMNRFISWEVLVDVESPPLPEGWLDSSVAQSVVLLWEVFLTGTSQKTQKTTANYRL